MTIDDFIVRSLLVPFKIGGRDYDGWDCWGLVYCAFRDVYGQSISSLAADYHGDVSYKELARLVDIERAEWLETPEPAPGRVALFRMGRYATHVALVLERSQMIHCERRAGTIVERHDSFLWAGRNVGFFQYRASTE